MMDPLLLPDYPIMVTFWLEPLKILPVDMPVRQDIMFKEDLVGIVMDYLLSTKLTKSWESSLEMMFWIWESTNIMLNAEVLL